MFLKSCAAVGISCSTMSFTICDKAVNVPVGKRVGIIGLDTSHSIAFSKALNADNQDPRLKGYRVISAYPYGSRTIESSAKRIPAFTKRVKEFGVSIADSIEELLDQVDVVLLETNDGRLHLEQALLVLKAGKRLFIDKPIAASLADTKAIFEAAEDYGIQTFSTSALRFVDNIASLNSGEVIGNITGADTFAPADLEPSHPDLFWYGIHGVEMLYALLGTGCREVRRIYTQGTDITVGIWEDSRIGVFRGIRHGNGGLGGIAYGENGQQILGKFEGYLPLLYHIIDYFETGIVCVSPKETIELVAFMEAADESKRRGGAVIDLGKFLG